MPIINQQSNNGHRSQKSTNRYPTYADSVKQCTRLESVHPSKSKEARAIMNQPMPAERQVDSNRIR